MPRPPIPPEQRQRRLHRRSRNGCITCKAKRVKCDELRPICSYCLRRGGDCTYTAKDDSPGPADAQEQSALERTALWNALPKDNFAGYPIDMPYESRMVLKTFIDCHGRDRKCNFEEDTNPIVATALSNPAYFHSGLLLTAMGWLAQCHTPSSTQRSFIRQFLSNKVEVERLVRENPRPSSPAAIDARITQIMSLALAESVLGSMDAVQVHVDNLQQMLAARGPPRVKQGHGLLGKMLKLFGRRVGEVKVRDIATTFELNGQHLPITLAPIRLTLLPLLDAYRKDKSLGDLRLDDAMKVLQFQKKSQGQCEMSAKVSRTELCRAAYAWCYVHLYHTMVGRHKFDPFVLSWYMETLIGDLECTKDLIDGKKNGTMEALWLWTALKGYALVDLTRAEFDWEIQEIESWNKRVGNRVRYASRKLNITDWEGCKEVLKHFVWRDGEDCEEPLRGYWETAVFGQAAQTPFSRSPSTEAQPKPEVGPSKTKDDSAMAWSVGKQYTEKSPFFAVCYRRREPSASPVSSPSPLSMATAVKDATEISVTVTPQWANEVYADRRMKLSHSPTALSSIVN